MGVSSLPQNLQVEHLLWSSGILRIAGLDEVGRGPLAGPVVAAAVIFAPKLHIAGVTDSKKLTAARRETFYDIIAENSLAWAIGRVDHEEIDRINIRRATFKAMRKAIGSLKITPEYLLIDGEPLPEKIYPQEGLIKGDSLSFTIAAASILAKVTRDREMCLLHEKFPQYGFDRHKGYGTRHHREMILEHGPCPIHRRSFLGKILSS